MRTLTRKGDYFEMLALAALAILFLTATALPEASDVSRGEYLVKSTGCADCHTPTRMGPSGPEPDMGRWLSGHPESMAITAPAKLPEGPWIAAFTATLTGWSGPWGVSFTANLTPDKDTGLGAWAREDFVNTIRTGRLLGKGRAILPPMPYQWMQNFTDEDLGAIYAYLHSLPPLKNRVPDPLPPTSMGSR